MTRDIRLLFIAFLVINFFACQPAKNKTEEPKVAKVEEKEEITVKFYENKLNQILDSSLISLDDCEIANLYIDSALQIDSTEKVLEIQSYVDSIKKHLSLLEEYETHMKSFRSNVREREFLERKDCVVNVYSHFIKHTIKYFAIDTTKYFISDRNLLSKKKNTICSEKHIQFLDTLKNGDSLIVDIHFEAFNNTKHTFEKDDNGFNKSIDGMIPYGGQYNMPTEQIASISITINDEHINIPEKAFMNLYFIDKCKYGPGNFSRPIEVYESINGDYIYVYFYGGEASDTWFGKLIFDREKYRGQIISDYGSLSIHGSFGEHFMGF